MDLTSGDRIGVRAYDRWNHMPNREAYVLTVMMAATNEAYRAGREDAAREARPMLNAVYSALDHASQLCRFHGAQYAATGFQFGLPRCESCRQSWRVAQALDLVNQARGVNQPRTPSGCDGEDSPEERQR